MANTKATVATLIDAGRYPDIRYIASRTKRFLFPVVMAAQPSADTIELGDIPAGFFMDYGIIGMDVAPNTSTVAVGTAASAALYRAAAAVTQAPALFGAAGPVLFTAKTRIIITLGTAALPAAGNLYIGFYGSMGD